jgi:DNA-binding response OmpR family regulator
MTKILIVDSADELRRNLATQLARAGYESAVATSGAEALAYTRAQRPDLVLLDVSLPDTDGFELLRVLRRELGDAPVIIVTARNRELDEIIALDLGADDYLIKPVDFDLILAHIKAVLRRLHLSAHQADPPAQELLTVGDVQIDLAAHLVRVGNRLIDLPHKEYELLVALARSAGHVLTIEELLSQVWGPEWIGESQTLYVHIHHLRHKLEEDPARPRRLHTVRSSGYKLVPVSTRSGRRQPLSRARKT